jgi:hypothetical protein
MAGLRRALFSILAAFAMLCGLGWTAAAYACPEPVAARPADDSCTHSKPVNSFMPDCGPVCLGVVPAIPTVAPVAIVHPPAYVVTIAELRGHVYAPDPPPPRNGVRAKQFNFIDGENIMKKIILAIVALSAASGAFAAAPQVAKAVADCCCPSCPDCPHGK